MELEKKALKNGEIVLNKLLPQEKYHIVQGNLNGKKYQIHIHPDLEYWERGQCFEIIKGKNLVSLPGIGTDAEETLLVAYPLVFDKTYIDKDKLTKKRIDEIALNIINEAKSRLLDDFIWGFLDSVQPYRGYVFLWKDRGPVIIVETDQWFNQNPNWINNLYEKTPIWKSER